MDRQPKAEPSCIPWTSMHPDIGYVAGGLLMQKTADLTKRALQPNAVERLQESHYLLFRHTHAGYLGKRPSQNTK